MPAVDIYRSELQKMQDWDGFLIKETRLPGPRSNLELLNACSDLAPREMLMHWLELSPEVAPENTPQCFLVCCGTAGLGRLLCEGDLSTLLKLKNMASDPRWRVRESVCMALQRFGKKDMPALLNEMNIWAAGSLLEQRAVIASLCEPVLLQEKSNSANVLNLVNKITENLIRVEDRKQEDFRVLRKALAYCWSVAVAALPDQGKLLMEHWLTVDNPDIRWIMKQNFQKNRLIKMDDDWVRQCNNIMEKRK